MGNRTDNNRRKSIEDHAMSKTSNSPEPIAISTVTVALLDLAMELRARHCGSGRNKPDGNGVLPAEDIAAGEVSASLASYGVERGNPRADAEGRFQDAEQGSGARP
jgi:hypothetical protein